MVASLTALRAVYHPHTELHTPPAALLPIQMLSRYTTEEFIECVAVSILSMSLRLSTKIKSGLDQHSITSLFFK